MIFEIGNLVEIRTTYGSIVGLLLELDQISRRCKVLTRKGGIIESDERYLILYGIGI